MFRRFRFIGVVLAVALIASACGGGGDDTSADPTTTTTAAPGGDGGTGASDTTTTTMEPVSGDSGSTYCERVREAEASDETPLDFNLFGLSTEELEAQFARNLAVFEEWRSIAPPEIKADADIVFDFYRTFVERGNELGWDLEAMADDEVFNSGFDDPALDTASVNLENHSRDVCGVDFTSSSSDGPPPPADGGDDSVAILLSSFGIPAGLLSEDDIECLREELGPEFEEKITPDYVLTTEDTLLIVGAVDTCEIGLG